LGDFGIARIMIGDEPELSLKGTPDFIAPEVLELSKCDILSKYDE
jgi:serine/threonine protein kinase